MAFQMKSTRRQLHSVILVAACLLAASFVVTTFVAPQAVAPRSPAVGMLAGGEYTGFVPDMQRRQLMNFVVVASAAVPVSVLLGGYLYYFYPVVDGGAGGATPCGDVDGNPVTLEGWVKSHKDNERELVQGLKGDPYYIISTADGVKDFALNSICTHLGCVVPWSKSANRFCCPCHGSQYDENGKVVRGPAPLSLALAHLETTGGKLAVSPWKEQDFRTGTDPWWKA